MEVVLQNQDFRSIEIMENNLQLQKNEVSLIFIVIRDILPVFRWKVTWNFKMQVPRRFRKDVAKKLLWVV